MSFGSVSAEDGKPHVQTSIVFISPSYSICIFSPSVHQPEDSPAGLTVT